MFAHIHYLGAHSAQWKRWWKVERAMAFKYTSKIWKLVDWGVKKERI